MTAAIVLAERLLVETENVNDFNGLLKSSIRPDPDASIFWNAQKYSQAKSSISEDGDGLGKDFVSHFMPKGSAPSNDTLQNALDSYYAESISNIIEQLPDLKAVSYDFDRQGFFSADGERFTDAMFKELANERGAREAFAGFTSLKRAAYFSTLLSRSGKEGGESRRLLAEVVQQLRQGVEGIMEVVMDTTQ